MREHLPRSLRKLWRAAWLRATRSHHSLHPKALALRRRDTTACRTGRRVLHLRIYSAQIRRRRFFFLSRGCKKLSKLRRWAWRHLKSSASCIAKSYRPVREPTLSGCFLFTEHVTQHRLTVKIIETALNLSYGLFNRQYVGYTWFYISRELPE